MSDSSVNIVGSVVAGIAASTAIVGAIVALLVWLDLQTAVIEFLRWLNGTGLWAPVIFVLVMAVAVIALLPGILLTTGAGFVFGVVNGTIAVVVGTTVGAAVAFLIARNTFGARAARYVLESPRLAGLDAQLSPHAWKIVCTTRFIPFFPAKLANYFFGLTSVSLRAFILGSLIGFVPLSLHNVYLGAFAAELTVDGLRTAEFGNLQWGVYIGGFVLVLIAVLYLARWSWRAVYSGELREDRRMDSQTG
ncbi:MAG TPA: TVP38/TMEM64 family protein [Gammaproteobacteria bacterium]|nr:TVP38/TMEM64 family protein [Gammaproteobacteria bacterium]